MGRLRAALDSLVERYEILRTDYRRVVGLDVPLQRIGSASAVVVDDVTEDAWRSRVAEPMDPAGPPLRVGLARRDDHLHTLFLRLPILNADAESVALLAASLAGCTATRHRRPRTRNRCSTPTWRSGSTSRWVTRTPSRGGTGSRSSRSSATCRGCRSSIPVRIVRLVARARTPSRCPCPTGCARLPSATAARYARCCSRPGPRCSVATCPAGRWW
ncbi:hypothetical protein NKG94_22110 [Micromonospora sp. M12]